MKHQVVVSGLVAGALGACASSPNPSPAAGPSLSHREKVIALLESLETGASEPVGYINPAKYTQHNLAIGDGLEGFGALMAQKPPQGFKAKVVRAYQDGDYVFTHTIYDFFGPKVGFDVFRFEGDLIVEHWDNLIDVLPANPSGRSQTDGPTAVSDLDATDRNKTLVRTFYTSVLIGGAFDRAAEFVAADAYAQHNPNIGDNLSGLASALEALGQQGITMEFHKVHQVLGEGNFVLVMAEGAFGGKPQAYYDLFRVEAGKIVEHWDVMAEIPPQSEWKNDNGKF